MAYWLKSILRNYPTQHVLKPTVQTIIPNPLKLIIVEEHSKSTERQGIVVAEGNNMLKQKEILRTPRNLASSRSKNRDPHVPIRKPHEHWIFQTNLTFLGFASQAQKKSKVVPKNSLASPKKYQITQSSQYQRHPFRAKSHTLCLLDLNIHSQ